MTYHSFLCMLIISVLFTNNYNLIQCTKHKFKFDFITASRNDSAFNPQYHKNSSSYTLNNTLLYYMNHDLFTYICLGETNEQCFDVLFSFQTYVTWICTNNKVNAKYNYTNSLTYESLKQSKMISADSKVVLGNKCTDVLDTELNFNTYINFFTVDEMKCDSKYSGEIGLNIKDLMYLSNSNDSLVEQFKHANIINNEIISIRYDNDFSGKVIFGDTFSQYKDVPFYELSTLSHSLVIARRYMDSIALYSNQLSRKLGVEKSHRKIFRLSGRAMLDYSSTFITLPYDLFIDIVKYVFNDDSNCELSELNGLHYVICNMKIFPNIVIDTFVIGLKRTMRIEMNIRKMFIRHKDSFVFGVVGKKGFRDVSLGDLFLRRYVTFLDRKNKLMRLYLKDDVVSDSEDAFFVAFVIWFVLAIVLMIIMFNVFYELVDNNKGKKKVHLMSKSSKVKLNKHFEEK